MKVYVVLSEDTEDRRARVLSVHKSLKGARAAVERFNRQLVRCSDGSMREAKEFGADATMLSLDLRE